MNEIRISNKSNGPDAELPLLPPRQEPLLPYPPLCTKSVTEQTIKNTATTINNVAIPFLCLIINAFISCHNVKFLC